MKFKNMNGTKYEWCEYNEAWLTIETFQTGACLYENWWHPCEVSDSGIFHMGDNTFDSAEKAAKYASRHYS